MIVSTQRPASFDTAPVHATQEERAVIADVERFLGSRQTAPAKLTAPDGQEVPLSAALCEVLRQAAHVLAQDETVAILSMDKLLTANGAANLLNISRPSLIHILDRGALPHTLVGTHRRILLRDVIAYMQVRDARRRSALESLVQQSEDLGLYDRT